MHVQVHYQGLDHSQWVDQFITRKVEKIERFLSPSASVLVHLKLENRIYSTTISVHNLNHDYAFSCDGDNLYESFARATDKATRALVEHKRRVKDRISRRSSLLNEVA